ncbi:unnamed protein product [Ranitomeya imitator]|uniref:Olfactory receptor n=1 Tax=Ranitomeya imitator TaxID=111125 RepID=A0ABN9MNW2_9NEOB|nr:unnamed protein product [Ranitomeya imitator]
MILFALAAAAWHWLLQVVLPSGNITSIILLGFSTLHSFKFLFFSLLGIIYCGVMIGNLLIVILYFASKTLQSPVYFFITQLSVCNILLSTDIVPLLLHTVLYGRCTMTFTGCIMQFFFFATSETSECLLLSVMSFERYLAICNPLRYNSITNHTFCVTLIVIIWLMNFIFTLFQVISINNLYFCGPHVVDHFYCDLDLILQLSRSDLTICLTQNIIFGFLLIFLLFVIIVKSDFYIAITIPKMPSDTGRHKAFSTCSSHLIVVSLFYGTLIIVYMVPTGGQSLTMSMVLSRVYTMLIPLLNPIIYTMRNKDFKEAFHKIIEVFYSKPKFEIVLSDTVRYLKVSVSDSIGRYPKSFGYRRYRYPIPIQVNGTPSIGRYPDGSQGLKERKLSFRPWDPY